MQTTETVGIVDNYQQNTMDYGFAIGSGILLMTVFVVALIAMGRWIMTTVTSKIDELKWEIKELKDEVGELKDSLVPLTVWANIDVKRTLNGSDKSND